MNAPDPRTVVHRTIAPPRSFATDTTDPFTIPPTPRPAPRWPLPLSLALFAASLVFFVATLHHRSTSASQPVTVAAKAAAR